MGNGHALELLAEEARRENINIRRLTEKGTRDAAAVKVLTIITLIYLPATVVSVSLQRLFPSTSKADIAAEFLLNAICDSGAGRRRCCTACSPLECVVVCCDICPVDACDNHDMVGLGIHPEPPTTF